MVPQQAWIQKERFPLRMDLRIQKDFRFVERYIRHPEALRLWKLDHTRRRIDPGRFRVKQQVADSIHSYMSYKDRGWSSNNIQQDNLRKAQVYYHNRHK